MIFVDLLEKLRTVTKNAMLVSNAWSYQKEKKRKKKRKGEYGYTAIKIIERKWI